MSPQQREAREGPFRCPRCSAVTWGALTYCNECGMYLYIECPNAKCASKWRYMYEHAFCPDCGTQVTGTKVVQRAGPGTRR